MLSLNVTLSYYKKKEIQEEIVYNSKSREVAARYNDKFGQRPDVLNHPADVFELVRQGATSFHASEELWQNPLHLRTDMRRSDLDSLRTGFDLILDIDCPYWQLSKIITWLIVKSLRDFGIRSISVKFSGNKGFHIGIPFEAFPLEVNGRRTKDLFPELPKAIASFLLDYVSENMIDVKEDSSIVFGKKYVISFQKLKEITSKSSEELTKKYCSECREEINSVKEPTVEFICPKCQSSVKNLKEQYSTCKKCLVLMERIVANPHVCSCGSGKYRRKFDPYSIIEVDTLLISSRHMFRMPYSLHEKSGLYSRPFNPDKILNFDKKFADPKLAQVSKWRFLDRENAVRGELKEICLRSVEYMEFKNQEKTASAGKEIDFADIAEIPRELFPPCIRNISKGVKDGRKRSLFVLVNFLTCCGWGYGQVEDFLKEWNCMNTEPLREVSLIGQVRYHKQNRKKILPPNCTNKMYYPDMGVCKPDNLCSKIKNPVNYALRKGRFLNRKSSEKKQQPL